ncbi:MAG: GDP-L-fucose synthase [Hydrogenothermaceae bacterium]|nr:GDP-L-fucose synthase [Hydrogenothermaceae bacterium]
MKVNKNYKIFVAGGTGMVGSSIIRNLISKGYSNIVSNYHRRRPLENYGDKVSFFPLDLTRQDETEYFFEKERPDYVFMASAKVGGILANNTYKAEFIYDNLAIALNVIHSSYKYGVKKLLNLGSSCIYPKHAPQPMKEEYLLTGALEATNEPYAVAKIAAIKLCRYYNEQYGTNFISVMPTNLYGPNDNFDLFTSHVLPALIRKFHLGKALMEKDWGTIRKDLTKFSIESVDGSAGEIEILKILQKYGIFPDYVEIWGSGEVYREFLHVDDLADACVFLMENIDAQQMKSCCPDYFVNVGTGKDIKIKDLAIMIKDIVGYKGEIKHDLSKPDGTPRKLLDVKTLLQFNWRHSIPLEKGIKDVYDWYAF